MNARLTGGRRRTMLAAAFLSLSGASPALAQDDEGEQERGPGWLVTVGGGAQVFPRYPGADDLGVNPMPILSFRRAGRPLPLEAPDEGWGFGLLSRDSAVDIGPAIQFQSRRREEDVGAPVGNVPFTVEAGAFVQAFLGESFRLRAEGRRGIGGHDGWVGDISADFFAASGDRYVFSIGPRLRLADSNYMGAYFGVTPAVAAQTGLAAFQPDDGIYAVGAATGLRYHLGDGPWAVHAYARFDRLVGDAADSPIVAGFGSRNQYGAGLGLSYTFRIRGSRSR